MATNLPVGIKFHLPDGWVAAPPDEVGEPKMAFVALHPESIENHLTAIITINGEMRPDAAPLSEIADQAVEKLREVSETIEVGERREGGTPGAPSLTQVVKALVDTEGRRRRVVQTQVFMSMLDVDDPRKRAVLKFALTSTPGQFRTVIGDFQAFIRSIRVPEPPSQAEG
jgi:hypothetical protein